MFQKIVNKKLKKIVHIVRLVLRGLYGSPWPPPYKGGTAQKYTVLPRILQQNGPSTAGHDPTAHKERQIERDALVNTPQWDNSVHWQEAVILRGSVQAAVVLRGSVH